MFYRQGFLLIVFLAGHFTISHMMISKSSINSEGITVDFCSAFWEGTEKGVEQ